MIEPEDVDPLLGGFDVEPDLGGGGGGGGGLPELALSVVTLTVLELPE